MPTEVVTGPFFEAYRRSRGSRDVAFTGVGDAGVVVPRPLLGD
jgi:hypothetical protein